MNYYHTAITYRDNKATATTKRTAKEMEVLEYRVRLGTSEDNIKAQMLRELDESVDLDDVNILIEPIF